MGKWTGTMLSDKVLLHLVTLEPHFNNLCKYFSICMPLKLCLAFKISQQQSITF